jgi:hypothetical protein
VSSTERRIVLAAYFGAVVEGDYRVKVIEQRADTITAVIPAPPERGTDAAARLAEPSGRIYDLLHSSGVGRYLTAISPGSTEGALQVLS